MTVSAKIEYACLAVLALSAEHERGRPIPAGQLATSHQIPLQFLSQILQQLRNAGLVQSSRGASGGYQLTRSPREITLADVVAVFQTPDVSACISRQRSSGCGVLDAVWQEIDEARQAVLSSTTLQDLLSRQGQNSEPMYYI